jgi:hypothetical protein
MALQLSQGLNNYLKLLSKGLTRQLTKMKNRLAEKESNIKDLGSLASFRKFIEFRGFF